MKIQAQSMRNKTIKFLIGGVIFTSLAFNFSYAQAQYSAGTLVTLTNSARAQNGLGGLATNSALASAAYNKAKDMFENNYFAHNSPSGKTPWDFIKEAGYSYSYAGENLAIGYTDPDELFSAWMGSPTHRENIINPNFREIGIAVVSGTFQGSETLIAVQEFGAPGDSSEQVAAEVSASPTPSVSPSAPTEKSFNFLKEKSSVSPQSIFAGEQVTFVVTISGEVKTLQAQVFEEKINLLETGTLSGDNEKTYTLEQKIENVGSSPVVVMATDKYGFSDKMELGQLAVKQTVISKETAPRVGLWVDFSRSLKNYWFLYTIPGVLLILVLAYFTLRKTKTDGLAACWRI